MVSPETVAFFIAAFTSLFTIVNPFSTASVFLTITQNNNKKEKRYMAKRASITAFIVLVVFAFLGNYILNFFSITVDAFRIAGGLIIMGIGWKMLKAEREFFSSEAEKKSAIDKEDVSVIPLAIPMLSGPGAITTTIVLMGRTSGVADTISVVLAIFLVCVISLIVLARADVITKYLKETGRRVLERIMGLIVLVVGVQFIINGFVAVAQLL